MSERAYPSDGNGSCGEEFVAVAVVAVGAGVVVAGVVEGEIVVAVVVAAGVVEGETVEWASEPVVFVEGGVGADNVAGLIAG